MEGVAAVEVVGGRAERDEREKWAGDVDRTIPPEPGLMLKFSNSFHAEAGGVEPYTKSSRELGGPIM